ncbi:MAG: transcriptional repressor [Chloroflexi bacterium]|nr:transcriptional repressor [Chloroflexota bacterium]
MNPVSMVDDLRQKGHRLTPQREMVLSVICESQGHISADEILKRVRKRYPYLNKSAVYRTLDLLTRTNLVHPTDLGQGCIEYEIHQHPHHHHLLCRNCHKMVEADESIFDSVEKTLREDYGFVADLDHFAIYGLCRKCQAQK